MSHIPGEGAPEYAPMFNEVSLEAATEIPELLADGLAAAAEAVPKSAEMAEPADVSGWTTEALQARYGRHFSQMPGVDINSLELSNVEVLDLLEMVKVGKGMDDDAALTARADLAKQVLVAYYEPIIRDRFARQPHWYGPDEAQSEAHVGLLRMIDDFTIDGKNDHYVFSAAVQSMASHKAIDQMRRYGRKPDYIDPTEMTKYADESKLAEERDETHDDGLIRREAGELLAEALQALSPSQRASLVLVEGFGFSSDEVAVHLDTSAGAARVAKHRGLQRMQDLSTTALTASDQEMDATQNEKTRRATEALAKAALLHHGVNTKDALVEAIGNSRNRSISALHRSVPAEVLNELGEPVDGSVEVRLGRGRNLIIGQDTVHVVPHEAFLFNTMMLARDRSTGLTATDFEDIGVTVESANGDSTTDSIDQAAARLASRFNEAAGQPVIQTTSDHTGAQYWSIPRSVVCVGGNSPSELQAGLPQYIAGRLDSR